MISIIIIKRALASLISTLMRLNSTNDILKSNTFCTFTNNFTKFLLFFVMFHDWKTKNKYKVSIIDNNHAYQVPFNIWQDVLQR